VLKGWPRRRAARRWARCRNSRRAIFLKTRVLRWLIIWGDFCGGDTMETLRMFIGGDWAESESGQYFDAYNPATLEVFARVPEGTRQDAGRAAAAAESARPDMARMSVWDRAALLHRIADVMDSRREELARTLSADQGKPYHSEALFEATKAASGFREAAEHLKF